MPTETLYADSLVSISSGTLSDSANVLGAPDGTFTTDGNTNTSWTARWKFDQSVGTGSFDTSATVTATVRKGSNSGNPTVDQVAVYDGNGSYIGGWLSATTITSTTGQDVVGNVNLTSAATLALPLEVRIITTGVAGSGTTRNAVELDGIELVGEFVPKPSTVAARTRVTGGGFAALEYFKPTSNSSTVRDGVASTDGTKIVLVNNTTTIVYSLNGGQTWSTKTIGHAPWRVAYGNGYFVTAASNGTAYYATDPSGTWTAADVTFTNPDGTPTLDYGNGWWAISNQAADQVAYINGDPTGTWTVVSATSLFGESLTVIYNLRYLGGTWLACTVPGKANYYTTSNPSTGWATTDGNNTNYWYDAEYNGTHYIAIGGTSQAWYTTTVGSGTWTEITYPSGWESTYVMSGVLYDKLSGQWRLATAGDGVPASGTQEAVSTTPDGSWTRVVDAWTSASGINVYPLRISGTQFTGYGATGGYVVAPNISTQLEILTPASPSTVAATTTIGTPTVTTGGGGDATATPSTVAASVSVGTPNLPALEEATTVSATATVGAVTVQVGAQPTPTTVAVVVSVGTPTVEQTRPYGHQHLSIA